MAIAFDNSVGASGDLDTVSYTNSGDLMLVHIIQYGSETNPSNITYGGNALTMLQSQNIAGASPARHSSLWTLKNPSTGSNSFSVTSSSSVDAYVVMTYSGTGGYTVTNFAQGKGATGSDPNNTYSGTLTVSDGSWLVVLVGASDATHDMTAGTDTVLRVTGHDSSNFNWGGGDSGGTLVAGSRTVTLNWITASNFVGSVCEIAIAPVVDNKIKNFLSLLGVS